MKVNTKFSYPERFTTNVCRVWRSMWAVSRLNRLHERRSCCQTCFVLSLVLQLNPLWTRAPNIHLLNERCCYQLWTVKREGPRERGLRGGDAGARVSPRALRDAVAVRGAAGRRRPRRVSAREQLGARPADESGRHVRRRAARSRAQLLLVRSLRYSTCAHMICTNGDM